MTPNRIRTILDPAPAVPELPALGPGAARVLALREVAREERLRRLEIVALLHAGLWTSQPGVVDDPNQRAQAAELAANMVRQVLAHDEAWRIFTLAHGDDPGRCDGLPGGEVLVQASALAAELAEKLPADPGRAERVETVVAYLNSATALWASFFAGKLLPNDAEGQP